MQEKELKFQTNEVERLKVGKEKLKIKLKSIQMDHLSPPMSPDVSPFDEDTYQESPLQLYKSSPQRTSNEIITDQTEGLVHMENEISMFRQSMRNNG